MSLNRPETVAELVGRARGAQAPVLLRYWDEKRAGRTLPRRADIDPIVERPGLVPHLIFIEIVEPGARFYCRVMGGAVVDYRRGLRVPDASRKFVDEIDHYLDTGAVIAQYAAAAARRAPVLSGGFHAASHPRAGNWERAVCPLSNDGAAVSHLIVSFERY